MEIVVVITVTFFIGALVYIVSQALRHSTGRREIDALDCHPDPFAFIHPEPFDQAQSLP